MKTKIVGFGDSFVFGSELANNDHGDQSWIGLSAHRLGVEYETHAVPGCGNEHIARQVFTYFSNNYVDSVVAVINWTWGARWDFYVPTVEQWTTLGLTCVPATLEHTVGLDEAGKILELYNKYPGHSILWSKWRTLQAIYSTQQFLKSLNVPSIQTYMDYEIWDRHCHAPDYIKTLQTLTEKDLENFQGQNFLDWSRSKGFPVTEPGWHPLEKAHQAASDLWIDRYRQLLRA